MANVLAIYMEDFSNLVVSSKSTGNIIKSHINNVGHSYSGRCLQLFIFWVTDLALFWEIQYFSWKSLAL